MAADSRAAAPTEQRIEVVPLEPHRFDEPPHVEVKFPLAGKRIAVEKARNYKIRIKTTGWSEQFGLLLMLDDFTPLVLDSPEKAVTLGDLVPEDRELSRGTHHLFVAAVHPEYGSVRLVEPRSRAPFAEVGFWIGDVKETPPAPSPTPRVVLLAPSGTFNGSRGENVLVDFRVLDLDGAQREVEVRVVRLSPAGRARGFVRLAQGQLAAIRSLGSGDYEVTVRLLDAEGNVMTSPEVVKSRTITVNRDVQVPE